MKAIAYQKSLPSTDPLALQDIDLPEPTPLARDLLVEVQAVAVNPVDTKVRQRQDPPAGEWKVLGWDAVGVVKTVGKDVSLFKPGDLSKLVAEACPDGVDVFFDNIRGEILDVGLANISQGACVVLCGRISGINADAPGPGPQNYFALTVKRARIEGFIYLDYRDKFSAMINKMSQWVAEGRITCKSDIVEGGISIFPTVFPRLFSDENFGKLMIKV